MIGQNIDTHDNSNPIKIREIYQSNDSILCQNLLLHPTLLDQFFVFYRHLSHMATALATTLTVWDKNGEVGQFRYREGIRCFDKEMFGFCSKAVSSSVSRYILPSKNV